MNSVNGIYIKEQFFLKKGRPPQEVIFLEIYLTYIYIVSYILHFVKFWYTKISKNIGGEDV